MVFLTQNMDSRQQLVLSGRGGAVDGRGVVGQPRNVMPGRVTGKGFSDSNTFTSPLVLGSLTNLQPRGWGGLKPEHCGGPFSSEHGLCREQLLVLGDGGAVEDRDGDVGHRRDVMAG